MVLSAFAHGAETKTLFDPFLRCLAAISFSLKIPVHSRAISTSFQSSSSGFLIAVTLIGPVPTSIVLSVISI